MLAKIFSTPDMNVRHFWVKRSNVSKINVIFNTLHITRVNRLTYHPY